MTRFNSYTDSIFSAFKFNTHRQDLINKKYEIVAGVYEFYNLIPTDGSVSTPKLTLGTMTFSSAGAPPNYDAAKGTVVFNQNPSIGGPLGWVSLGQTRWANFGIIE